MQKGTEDNKGGGRRSLVDEKIRRAVIEKCWEFLQEEMEREDTPRGVKREIAMKLAAKSVPQDINVATRGFDINIW